MWPSLFTSLLPTIIVLVPRTCILEYRAYLFYRHNAWVVMDFDSVANVIYFDLLDPFHLEVVSLFAEKESAYPLDRRTELQELPFCLGY